MGYRSAKRSVKRAARGTWQEDSRLITWYACARRRQRSAEDAHVEAVVLERRADGDHAALCGVQNERRCGLQTYSI